LTAKTYVFFNGVFIETQGGATGPSGPSGPQGSFAVSTSWWLGV
jgi:hypothetical protein